LVLPQLLEEEDAYGVVLWDVKVYSHLAGDSFKVVL
jgi:hypothetical protein